MDASDFLTQPWRDLVVAGFDLETTGKEPGVDRIIEIGIARFEKGDPLDTYQSLVQPGAPIPEIITSITGISDEDVADAPRLESILEDVLERLSAQPLLAYNHTFDLNMLQGELDRLGRTATFPPCIDPFPFCWVHLRNTGLTKNAQLGTICEHFGITLDAAHRADHDAAAAVRVLHALDELLELPRTLGELLDLQRSLAAVMEADFQRFRKRSRQPGSALQQDDVRIELGAAWLYGDEPDPIRAIFRRVPDVRDLDNGSANSGEIVSGGD